MKCIICKRNEDFGLQFDSLQNEPFFCQRCLFLILMRDADTELTQYCNNINTTDDTRSPLAVGNIWKEEV